MKYELLKQLKKAGYPIVLNQAKFSLNSPWGTELSEDTEHYGYNDPILSELIEACGDGFKHLDKEGKLWYAYNINGHSKDEGELTPEEAVAYLWLELNK